MESSATAWACAGTGIQAGRRIREAVHGLSPQARAARTVSTTKPIAGTLTRHVDQVGEEIAVEELEGLARQTGYRIDLVVNPRSGELLTIGRSDRSQVIFAYLDAVDGTIKVGGLGNELERGRFRSANDGGWAAALAFTLPTAAPLERVRVGDFVCASIVEGNPTHYVTSPQEVVTVPVHDGLATYDVTGHQTVEPPAAERRRVFTTTNRYLAQAMVYLDSFQAFDRATRLPGDETLAVELYRRFINRHDGGAFDVLRQYANLSALLRVMLGWRDEPVWTESQGGAFVVVNENMFNLVPAVATIAGAGGQSVDFDGRRIADRLLVDERTSIVHAANDQMLEATLSVIAEARSAS